EISNQHPNFLYFKPKDPNDILGDITFPKDIELTFVDKNTIKIETKQKVGDVIKLKIKSKNIKLLVSS
ncbi:MAG: hypothetical protein GXO30_04125, partial [Epsilonproteobacteria bacterium]|nr:hypothetical protein [Campylobacterota bacterium]